MKKILISDTHYGVKNNSLTWLRKQLDFIHKQLIPYCKSLKKEGEEIVIYHLGDMFDSRSSISPFVAHNVKKAYEELSKQVNDIYVIGGNHDYYSPQSDEVNSLEMVFHNCDFIHIITKSMYINGSDLLVPWYEYEDSNKLDETIKNHSIRRVFCHADLPHISPLYSIIFNGVDVYSGHIHTPLIQGNLHTLGSTYALTFADCNSERGFYVLNEDNSLEFIPNEYSIKFYRFKNDEIFDVLDKVDSEDYVELYIDQILLLNDDYSNQIKEIGKKIHNTNIIPVSKIIEYETQESFDNYNIEEMCKENIPDELKEKFDKILKKDENA